MEVVAVDKSLYTQHVHQRAGLFHTADFAAFNAAKVEAVHYLLFKDSRFRLGLILGSSGTEARSPFSAPFGGFSPIQEEVKAAVVNDALHALEKWLSKHGYRKITMVLPALYYDGRFLTRMINGLFVSRYRSEQIDLNHHMELPANFDQNYPRMLQKNARKNLKNALKQDFRWQKLPLSEAKRAYEVIAVNRKVRQKPLRMSLEQVLETSERFSADFFVVEYQQTDVAAAIVFPVTARIVQVIYWGDNPSFSDRRPMNFLTYKLFEYYANQSIYLIDIGTSTENSVPNYGLCEFKESIGCSVSLKYTFSKEVSVCN
ncbi:hypothetical protein [Cyclobacterium xiamenense]|uniref:hypothetical protein n=1 Tax=Cyclobacterium xiamenense TaxID=1297121 RepID=UPI0012B963BE|nr:hypothetical protein [Cyclobacterium xiamenense]